MVCSLFWWLDFPYAELLDIYIVCIVPSECTNWATPCHYLVWSSSTLLTVTTKATIVYKIIYFLPLVVVIYIKPYLQLDHSFCILVEVIYYNLLSNPFTSYG